jgi:GT2 family glycosyltransferase
MQATLPEIGVVIIGVNVERYLADCIRSVQTANYPAERLKIVYVDGGSRDASARIAGEFENVAVIELNDRHPTPGRGRNAGWKHLSTPLIQFMDADTVIDPDWFERAFRALDNATAAVCGHRRERYPHKNAYHRFTEMEWHYETGPCRYFGGEVLVRRSVLEATGGFDENLVAGEDPELSYRIRRNGQQILRIDAPMSVHDINMTAFRQYLKRAYRSGYAYAEIALRFIRNPEKLWLKESIRILAKALLPIGLVVAGALTGNIGWGLLLGALILLRPLINIDRMKQASQQPWGYVLLYAGHTALVVYPQFWGMLRYFWGRATGRPLRNKGLTEPEARRVSGDVNETADSKRGEQ